MNLEGEIHIELYRHQGRVDKVSIHSSRPLQLTTLFKGKSVSDLLNLVPSLYSVCATAQACAAAQACRQAVGLHGDARVNMVEGMLVAVETAREHLWHLLIDWSGYVDDPVDRTLISSLSNLLPKAKHACFADSDLFTLEPTLALDHERFSSVIEQIANAAAQAVFLVPPAQWYANSTVESFNRWLDETSTPSAKLLRWIRDGQSAQLGDAGCYPLPIINPLEMCKRLADEDAAQFIATPDWKGAIFETTAMTRMASHPLLQHLTQFYGYGLMTRLVARLLELASIPGKLNDQLQALIGDQVHAVGSTTNARAQEGLGEVEAARGRLIHRAVLDKGMIAKYQILAPTEWNFHPRGVVARGLLSLPAEKIDSLRQHADLLINTVDPCVGYRIEVI